MEHVKMDVPGLEDRGEEFDHLVKVNNNLLKI